MSEENKSLALLPNRDFTMKDLEVIKEFKDKGLMGLAHITPVDVERFMGLYMDGKTYRQIAQLTKKGKAVILYLAEKFNWYELRREYLDELSVTLKDKIMESKLQSQEFLLELVLAYQKKVSRNIHEYLRTDDPKHADKIDQKDIGTVLKVMELLHRLSSENIANNDKPLVGLSGLGEGMTITKTGANTVQITPSPFSNKLKAFADMKRQQEKDSQPPPKVHDIDVEETLTKKEKENE